MKTNPVYVTCTALITCLAILPACEEKQSTPATQPQQDDHGHAHTADGGHPSPEPSKPGHGGAVIQLGSATVGPFEAKATRDEGQIVAGKDAPIDVTVTPAAGAKVKATAVRFWIGTEDAKGSVKAKAEIENPTEPNRWHTHAEIPSPIPAGSKLWVEIEDDKGQTHVGGFELKA